MDNDRRPRQNAGYASQQGALLPPQASYPMVSAADRFRQAPLTSHPASTHAASGGSRGGSGSGSGSSAGASASAQSYGYGYGEGAQFNVAQYPHYGQGVMYSEPVQQYQQNRDSAIEVLGTNFGVAQPQYYGAVPSEGGPTSAPAPSIATQNVPSPYPSLGYTTPQAPVGREPLAPAYTAAGMTDPHQPTAGGYAQQNYSDQQHSSGSGSGHGHGNGNGNGNEYDDFYNNYQTELKKTFEYIRDDRLSEAAAQLFSLSDWLLQWAETLGLVRDDENHQQQRLKLWEEFNNGWLSLLQKQKEMVQRMASTNQRPPSPQSVIEYDFLEKMGTQLVKNCDNMEKHGLVDYQMGVWEEEIVAMLTACLDQLDEMGAGSASSQQHLSASSTRRR